ncbi:hypothetical protein MTO96_045112 [Rhipicephalus appendiculatus]
MANEVEEVSQMTMQVLSELERSSERGVKRVDLRKLGAGLCAELDDIKRIAKKWWSCETTTRHQNMERDGHVDNLESLQREVRSISSKLEEVKNKVHHEAAGSKLEDVKNVVHCEAAARTPAAEEVLIEVLSVPALTCEVICDDEIIKLKGSVRVMENELRVPVEVVWGVRNWSKLARKIKANKLIKCGMHVDVAHRYRVHLYILAHPDGRQRFQFWPCVSEEPGATLKASPKRMKMVFLNGERRGLEHELYRAKSGSFLTHRFGVADLEGGVSVQEDRLEVCFDFFY